MTWDTEVAALTGLVGWWNHGESSGTASDNLTGDASKDGVLTGSPSLAHPSIIPSKTSASCMLVNGTSQYNAIPDHNDFSLTTTGALSIGIVCKPVSTTAGTHTIIGKGNSSGTQWEWGITRGSTPTFQALIFTNTGTNRTTASPPAGSKADDAPYFLVITMDDSGGDSLIMYMNGVAGTAATSWSGASTNGTSVVNIGRRADASQYFSGYIQDVFITNTVLSSGTVTSLYAAFLTPPTPPTTEAVTLRGLRGLRL